MAEIDKALPNVEQTIKTPSEEELQVATEQNIQEQVGPEDVKIEEQEDGSVEINFDSRSLARPGPIWSNLTWCYASPAPEGNYFCPEPTPQNHDLADPALDQVRAHRTVGR